MYAPFILGLLISQEGLMGSLGGPFDDRRPPISVDAVRLELSADATGKTFADFVLGAHATVVDVGNSNRLAVRDAIADEPAGARKKMLAVLESAGVRALRFWDGYWLAQNGGEENAYVMQRFGITTTLKLPSEGGPPYRYPTYRQLLDFAAAEKMHASLVVHPFYFDPEKKRVYSTIEVAENSGGILERAAEANAGSLAAYHRQRGYANGLVLEIGNETIGYGNDPPPTHEQYGRLLRAFASAAKSANPGVQIGAVVHLEGQLAGWMKALREQPGLVDLAIVHLYDVRHPRASGLSRVSDVTAHFDNLSGELLQGGFGHVRFLVTEYALDLWSARARSYRRALDLLGRQLAIAAHPAVGGMHIHNFPNGAIGAETDGARWTIVPPGSIVASAKNFEHVHDLDPFLGKRWAILPSGATHALLSRVLSGRLVQYFVAGENGEVSVLITREDELVRVLVLNNQPHALRLASGTKAVLKSGVQLRRGDPALEWVRFERLRKGQTAHRTINLTRLPDTVPEYSVTYFELK